jgi:hypothetical protein
MPYLFKDLIVTVVPRLPEVAASGGTPCGCTDGGTSSVGSCTSECGVECLDSGEILEIQPYTGIDPAYRLELRQMLVHALAHAGVEPPNAIARDEIAGQLQPQTVEDARAIEQQLEAALAEARDARSRLEASG